MLSATETSSQSAANMPLPRQSGGAKPMACRIAVEAVPAFGQRLAGGSQLLRRGHVDLQDVGLAGQFAGASAG